MQRGKTPILVGGTGFYLRMYIYGKAGGKATPGAAAKGEALIQEAKAACAASHGLPMDEMEAEDLWNASVDVLLGLGDPESAARCASGQTCICVSAEARTLEQVVRNGVRLAVFYLALSH